MARRCGRRVMPFDRRNLSALTYVRHTERVVDPIVAQLTPLRFSAAQAVAAARISADALTNYLTKDRLQLISDSPGRGKARGYPLIDVQILALQGHFTRLTGNARWTARAIENYVYMLGDMEAEDDAKEDQKRLSKGYIDFRRDELRELILADSTEAHPIFWDVREREIILTAGSDCVGDLKQAWLGTYSAETPDIISASGYFVNVSRLFRAVELRLCRTAGIGRNLPDHLLQRDFYDHAYDGVIADLFA